MGMTGLVFVRPAQDGNTLASTPAASYAYNDGDGSTGFDREFAMFLSEVWGDSHWADAHIQLPEWSDYRADFSLLNGRVYPDTLAARTARSPARRQPDPGEPQLQRLPGAGRATGTWSLPAGPARDLGCNQPISALVTCNAGERVLLRFANLGFKEAAMTLAGIKMRVVGQDATHMRGRGGFDTSYETNTLSFGAGESFDAIFTAPPSAPGRARTRLRHVRPLQPRLHPRRQPRLGRRHRRRPADRGARVPGRRPAGPGLPQPAPGRPGVRPAMSGVTTMQTIHAPARPRSGWRSLVSSVLVVQRAAVRRRGVRPTAAATEGSNTSGVVCTTDGRAPTRPST